MKQLLIRMTLCFLSFCLFAFSAQAQQQFKWVTGGGTSEDLSADPLAAERTQYMCTDANGNVYALSQVGTSPIYADTFIRLSGAYGSSENVLVTSYNCVGQMRWAKLLSSNEGTCTAAGIVADNSGNIYVAGSFTNANLYIGYDTIITGLANDGSGLIQFDTAGHFKWVQYVGDNTASTYNASAPFVLTMDGADNVHMFTYIKDGLHVTPSETSIYGTYDMVYNSSGTLLSSVRLDLDSEWYLNGVAIDPITNKLYVSGAINNTIFGGFLTDTAFAAAFDASRNLLWQYFTGNDTQASYLYDIVLDHSKHLHFAGGTATSIISVPSTFSFNGLSVSNTLHPDDAMSIVMTTDTNGHPQWIKKFDGDEGINGLGWLTELSNNSIAATGTFVGTVTDGLDSITTPPSEGQNPFFVVVDSAGNLQIMQQIHGDGFYDEATAITSDKVGNIYFGGEVADSIFGGTIPAYHTHGGNSDFFVMKYGVDCSCTSGPAAAFSDTGTHHTIGVTYTGTTTGLDSVVWNFGDGSNYTGTSTTHTYAAADTYNVCVTTYTDCGIDEHCGNFVVDSPTHVLVPNIVGSSIQVYPNPARDELNVMGLMENMSYRLLSVTGTCVLQGSLQRPASNISMQGITHGVYVLELTGLDGERNIIRVVKE